MDNTTEQENNRNEDGTFKEGFSGNPGGRPKGSLKSFMATKFAEMKDEEKEKFLVGIDKDIIWKMAEGNPANATDITTGGNPFPLLGGQSHENTGNNSNKEAPEAKK